MDVLCDEQSHNCEHYSAGSAKDSVIPDLTDIPEVPLASDQASKEQCLAPDDNKQNESWGISDFVPAVPMSESSESRNVHSVIDRSCIGISVTQPHCVPSFMCAGNALCDYTTKVVNFSPRIQDDDDKFVMRSELNSTNSTNILQSMFTADKNDNSDSRRDIVTSMPITCTNSSLSSVHCNQTLSISCGVVEPVIVCSKYPYSNPYLSGNHPLGANDSFEPGFNQHMYTVGSNFSKTPHGPHAPQPPEADLPLFPQKTLDPVRKTDHSRGSNSPFQAQIHHCSLCGKQYRHVASLRNHARKHSSGLLASKRYKCPHCVYSSQYHRNVIKHIESNHRNRDVFSEDTNDNSSNNTSVITIQSPGTVNLLPEDMKNNAVWASHIKREGCHYNQIANNIHVSLQNPSLTSTVDPLIIESYPTQNAPTQINTYRYELAGCSKPVRSMKYADICDTHRDFKKFKCQFEGCSFGGQRRGHLKRHISECHGVDKKHTLNQMLQQSKFGSESQVCTTSPLAMEQPIGYSSVHGDYLPYQQRMMLDGQSVKGRFLNFPPRPTPCPMIMNCRNENPNHCNQNTTFTSNESMKINDNNMYAYCSPIKYYNLPRQEQEPESNFTDFHNPSVNQQHHTPAPPFVQVPQATIQTVDGDSTETIMFNKYTDPTKLKGFVVADGIGDDEKLLPTPLPNATTMSTVMNQSANHLLPSLYSQSNSSVYTTVYSQSQAMSGFRVPDLVESDVANFNRSMHAKQSNIFLNSPFTNLDCSNAEQQEQDENTAAFQSYSNSVDNITTQIVLPNQNNTLLNQILSDTDQTVVCDVINQLKQSGGECIQSNVETLSQDLINHTSGTVDVIEGNNSSSATTTNNPNSDIGNGNIALQSATAELLHVGNVTSETDAFLSDLQEILARDMPLLNTSTPKYTDSVDYNSLSELIRDPNTESKSPLELQSTKHMSLQSLPSSDSGHETCSTNSNCSVGPNNTIWGQQESNSQLKISSPFIDNSQMLLVSTADYPTRNSGQNPAVEQLGMEYMQMHDYALDKTISTSYSGFDNQDRIANAYQSSGTGSCVPNTTITATQLPQIHSPNFAPSYYSTNNSTSNPSVYTNHPLCSPFVLENPHPRQGRITYSTFKHQYPQFDYQTHSPNSRLDAMKPDVSVQHHYNITNNAGRLTSDHLLRKQTHSNSMKQPIHADSNQLTPPTGYNIPSVQNVTALNQNQLQRNTNAFNFGNVPPTQLPHVYTPYMPHPNCEYGMPARIVEQQTQQYLNSRKVWNPNQTPYYSSGKPCCPNINSFCGGNMHSTGVCLRQPAHTSGQNWSTNANPYLSNAPQFQQPQYHSNIIVTTTTISMTTTTTTTTATYPPQHYRDYCLPNPMHSAAPPVLPNTDDVLPNEVAYHLANKSYNNIGSSGSSCSGGSINSNQRTNTESSGRFYSSLSDDSVKFINLSETQSDMNVIPSFTGTDQMTTTISPTPPPTMPSTPTTSSVLTNMTANSHLSQPQLASQSGHKCANDLSNLLSNTQSGIVQDDQGSIANPLLHSTAPIIPKPFE